MGLDFTHCNACWAYGGFNDFRRRLAIQIGINLNEMEGFRPFAVVHGKIIDIDRNWVGKPWKNIKDPIKYLLNHSDCDGHLTPLQCKKVAPRLRELVREWDDADYDKQMAWELIKGMQKAAKANQKLEFL